MQVGMTAVPRCFLTSWLEKPARAVLMHTAAWSKDLHGLPEKIMVFVECKWRIHCVCKVEVLNYLAAQGPAFKET